MVLESSGTSSASEARHRNYEEKKGDLAQLQKLGVVGIEKTNTDNIKGITPSLIFNRCRIACLLTLNLRHTHRHFINTSFLYNYELYNILIIHMDKQIPTFNTGSVISFTISPTYSLQGTIRADVTYQITSQLLCRRVD